MNKFLMPLAAATFLSLSAQAQTLICMSRDQDMSRGYEVKVSSQNAVEVRFRGGLIAQASTRKTLVPTAGGGFRTDYVSSQLQLVVSSKSGGDNGNYSMLYVKGVKGPVLLYCAAY